MLRIPRRSTQPGDSIYAKLGLKDLPFPTVAVSDPYNDDPRRNGTIYAENPVRSSIQKFEGLLIKPNDFQNRVRLAYLWSKGDQESGRGMGKTALLRYFRQRINHDWGHTEFNGQFSALVVYVSFPNQVDRRYMEQLALAGLADICKSGVLDASRAALRLQYLTDQQVQRVVETPDGSEDLGNLLNDGILEQNKIDPLRLDGEVADRLRREGIQYEAALRLSQGGFEEYLRSFRKTHSLEPLYVPRDTRILDLSRSFLFNDVVLYLRVAGFQGGYLFIDDIENLVDQMPRRSRVQFAKDFALCTVRPQYANVNHNFFSCVLTTHQASSIALAAAWGEAGLSGIARLDPNDPNSVELPLPNPEEARQIVIAHLDYYRVSPDDVGTIKPFTEDGIQALLKNSQHPRILLTTAAAILSRAAQEGISLLDAAFVNSAKANTYTTVVQDFTEGLAGAL